ncbi:MAG: TfoX/Sxy family protein [Proteobacteria bacterium]|nr:TfoX/Sxy family protein [Pseudomonadota bacterium]
MDRDDLAEFFSSYGPVSVKRMFSGFGVYAEDVCFAVFLRGELFLKADPASVARFEAEGSSPFSYSQKKSGKVVRVDSWWRLPARLYDEPDELAEWTRAAVAVAHAASVKKKSRKRTQAAKRPVARKPAVKKSAAQKSNQKKSGRAAPGRRKLNRKKR